MHKRLKLQSCLMRFIFVTLVLTSFYNPSHLSVVHLLQLPSLGGWVRITLATVYLIAFIVLLRQTYCGFQPYGRPALILPALALIWLGLEYGGPLLETPGMAFTTTTLLASAIITAGQVSAHYVRQVSGQSSVVKRPP